MAQPGEFELQILLAILRLCDGAYGVTIREELERQTSRALSLGAVYKTLGRLENKGWLKAEVAPPTKERGGRRKKMYTLTSAGEEATRRALADLRKLTQGLEAEFLLP